MPLFLSATQEGGYILRFPTLLSQPRSWQRGGGEELGSPKTPSSLVLLSISGPPLTPSRILSCSRSAREQPPRPPASGGSLPGRPGRERSQRSRPLEKTLTAFSLQKDYPPPPPGGVYLPPDQPGRLALLLPVLQLQLSAVFYLLSLGNNTPPPPGPSHSRARPLPYLEIPLPLKGGSGLESRF